MRIYIAWTLANPVGWEPYDITRSVDIRKLPSKPVPTGGEVIDQTRGWVAGVNVQGVSIIGFDHYHPRINPTDNRLIDIVAWNDDPVDWSYPWAVVWSFANPRTDPRVGQRLNTEQYCHVYGDDNYLANDTTTGGPVLHSPWSSFVVPSDSNLNRHGIWVTDPVLWELHLVRMQNTNHGWREWIAP